MTLITLMELSALFRQPNYSGNWAKWMSFPGNFATRSHMRGGIVKAGLRGAPNDYPGSNGSRCEGGYALSRSLRNSIDSRLRWRSLTKA